MLGNVAEDLTTMFKIRIQEQPGKRGIRATNRNHICTTSQDGTSGGGVRETRTTNKEDAHHALI